MNRFLPRHGDLTSVNLTAGLEQVGPKLVVVMTISADVMTPAGKRRMKSQQNFDLQNFLDACARAAAGKDPNESEEPAQA